MRAARKACRAAGVMLRIISAVLGIASDRLMNFGERA